jgi:hypothetical protein
VVAAPVVIKPVTPTVGVTAKVKHHTIDKVAVTSIGNVTINRTDYDTLSDAWSMRQSGALASVLVTGPSGTAKTLMVKRFAESLGVPFIKVDGGSIRTADDWFGSLRQDPTTQTWGYQFSPFGQALLDGTPCIVLLDEANRAETPQALNSALGLLDETGTAYIPDARVTLTMPKGVMVVVTANKGAEYVGTVPFDAAVVQRFAFGIRLDYPVEKVEVKVLTDVTGIDSALATTLVGMAAQQRPLRHDMSQFPSGTGVSTRMLVDISRRIVATSVTPRQAILSTFAAQFDTEDETALSIIVDAHFPPEGESGAVEVDTNAINEADGI